MRLDIYLVEHKLFESREKASYAIKNSGITVDGKIINKPSFDIDNQKVEIVNNVNPFVSRGGFKLDHAIKFFNLEFNKKVVLDIGASTGGFTDVALQNNAKKVVCVDVGSNQLHDKIKTNDKVEFYENLNILDFQTKEQFDYLVMDVSFVSIKTIIPSLIKFFSENTTLVALIKPQYEVGKVKIKNGVVKDKKIQENIVIDIINFINDIGLNVVGLTPSPITGKMGNKEYLILINKKEDKVSIDVKKILN